MKAADQQSAQYANAERGRERYERELRALLESDHSGKYLALDVESGPYEIADTLLEASHSLRERLPNASVYGTRIGRSIAYRIGGHRRTSQP